MTYLVLCLVAFLASCLTLFSGFGLGTILLPAFCIFFPVDLSVALTAIVHFLNNVFKLFLLGKHIDRSTAISFGLPSILAAFAGAWLLGYISDMGSMYDYTLSGHRFSILPVKFIIALLLIFFALFDVLPVFRKWQFDRKYLPVGGVLSGFFGGLSGHQGALRSAFLLRAGLSAQAFIATGVVIACCIDLARLAIYSDTVFIREAGLNTPLVIAATLAAFAGAFLGNKMLKKVTIISLQNAVAVMLILFALAMGSGLI